MLALVYTQVRDGPILKKAHLSLSIPTLALPRSGCKGQCLGTHSQPADSSTPGIV